MYRDGLFRTLSGVAGGLLIAALVMRAAWPDIKGSGNIGFDANNDGATEMYMNTSGLGIATTSPSSNLHVQGNAIFQSGNFGIGTTAPSHTMHISGTLGFGAESVSTNSMAGTKPLVLANTASGNIILKLPYAGNATGRIYHIKKTSSSNTLTIDGNGSLIDNSANISMTNSTSGLPFAVLMSNGTTWYILAKDESTSVPATFTWTNGGGTGLASAASNWSGGAAPSAGAVVTLNGTSTANLTWDLNVSIASWNQTSAYTGNVIINTNYSGNGSFTLLDITGDLTISGGSWTQNPNSTVQGNLIKVAVGGNFTLASGATITVGGKGYTAGNGTGGATSTGQGGSHGGRGNHNTTNNYKTYGKFLAPDTLGSGGDSSASLNKGGGAIYMTITGDSTVNGTIEAQGNAGTSNAGGGSGGSIYFKTKTLTGTTGVLSASGGPGAGTGGGGGGGRVAVLLTGASSTFSGFTGSGNLKAYGGAGGSSNKLNGGNGTVYKATGTQSGNASGNIIIENSTSFVIAVSSSGNGTTGADLAPRISGLEDSDLDLTTFEVKTNSMLVISGNTDSTGGIKHLLLSGGNVFLSSGNLVVN